MIQSYEDLEVYKRSYRISIEMYRETMNFPPQEMYGLTSQIKRAATSIPLNIAEGYAKRESGAEFKRFLLMSIGSCSEMIVLLDMSRDLGFMNSDVVEKWKAEYVEIRKMLTVLRERWTTY